MTYLYQTENQLHYLLNAIGIKDVEELFQQIPEPYRLQRKLDLPQGLSELELQQHVEALADQNGDIRSRICFQGGGAYDHFIPAVVDEIASRSEFYTAYTPYQAEASQGSLQTFFEYQTLICQLTGMDVSNASLYEGGTSLSEAAFMSMRATKRYDRVVMLGSVHPEYQQVLATYLKNLSTELIVIPTPRGTGDLNRVEDALDDSTACLLVQHPNFFGCLEDAAELTELAHRVGALMVVSVDPVSLGLLQRPGAYGADIVVAEGQSLGIPLQYGGPYLGILACREKFVRKMPGRLIGQTVDRNGKTCYVLGLQTREQHIRRDKATSNICTNQGLLALRATVTLALLGPQGLRELSERCCQKAHYLAKRLTENSNWKLKFDRPFFKEFLVESSSPLNELMKCAREKGFDIGPGLSQFSQFEDEQNSCLIAVTEKRTQPEMDELVEILTS